MTTGAGGLVDSLVAGGTEATEDWLPEGPVGREGFNPARRAVRDSWAEEEEGAGGAAGGDGTGGTEAEGATGGGAWEGPGRRAFSGSELPGA